MPQLTIKQGIQVVAIDDGIHHRGGETTGLVFAFCAGTWLEKVLYATIAVDGLDATGVVIDTLDPYTDHFRIILTHGVTVGGLNLLDLDRIHEALGRPVIAVIENEPSTDGPTLYDAIKNVPDADERKDIIDRALPMHVVKTAAGENDLFFYTKGIDERVATQYLKKFAVRSRLPECLLLAHKIGSGQWSPAQANLQTQVDKEE
jgi:hypothetical protein